MSRVSGLALLGALALAGCGSAPRTSPDLSPRLVARLHAGMTKAQVRTLLGPPREQVQIPYPTKGELDQGFEDCWNYGTPSVRHAMYQLCFWSGHLSSQAKYGGLS